MYTNFQKHLQKEIQEIKDAGLYKEERIIVTPQSSGIEVKCSTSVPTIISAWPTTAV